MRLRSKRARVVALATIALVIGATWLVVLPRVAKQSALQESTERLESLGVNPGALFYSDHRLAWD